jgi:hypothetical protein
VGEEVSLPHQDWEEQQIENDRKLIVELKWKRRQMNRQIKLRQSDGR